MKKSQPRKLEIGCGKRPTPGYEHLDAYPGEGVDHVADARELPFGDNEFDEVYSHWVFEHFATHELEPTLLEWKRVLKPGGKVWIVTNNQAAHNKALNDREITWGEWVRLTYGIRHKSKYTIEDCHKTAFSPEVLYRWLEKAGFKNITWEGVGWEAREKDQGIKCPGLSIIGTK